MKIFNIKDISKIYVGEKLENLTDYLKTDKCVIITDSTVKAFYKNKFPKFPVIEIGQSEKVKIFSTIEFITKKFLDLGVDRSYYIVGIGGGIVCDITGFIASIYMRGLPFCFVSSTLLSQVDASVGGKNGVNFLKYKNLLGTFSQPQFVICDTGMVRTLPKKEIINGYAEIIKHSLIKDKNMFITLEKTEPLSIQKKIVDDYILNSIKIKSAVVNEDEKEKGVRKILNFGHTIGHAVENFYKLDHGMAVGYGMLIESEISFKMGSISFATFNQIKNLLYRFSVVPNVKVDKNIIMENIKKDKKRIGDKIDIVLLNGIGECGIENISFTKLDVLLETMFQ